MHILCLGFLAYFLRDAYCVVQEQPVQPVNINTELYSMERLHIMTQYLMDKMDESQNFRESAPGRLNRKIVKITQATVQKPNGVIYNVTAYFGDRDCSVNQAGYGSCGPCGIKKSGQFYLCWIEIWQRPWENYIGETAHDCRTVDRRDVPKV